MTKKTKKYCESIAREYGAKLKWLKNDKKHPHGYYLPGTNKIFVSSRGSDRIIISIFCHELGHYQNFLNKKYYKYHSLTGKKYMRTFKRKHALVRYALDAELYTDKVGRRLCKELFPGIKYHASYRDNKAWYNFFYQKYFGGFFLILLEKMLDN